MLIQKIKHLLTHQHQLLVPLETCGLIPVKTINCTDGLEAIGLLYLQVQFRPLLKAEHLQQTLLGIYG